MTLYMELKDSSYEILVERGALNRVKDHIPLNRKALIVTDTGVPKEYAEAVAKWTKEPYIVTIPMGEASKSIENYTLLLEKMLKAGFTRTDCVISVGGGVVGDLSGFAAASYMRGIDFYNIPTTLLSQIDSSIGGKVAIDFKGYKNIVGAFYQPKGVIIDPSVLKTLDKRQLANGLAEAIKMAATSDKELFELIEGSEIDKNIEKIIISSLKIKKSVVEQDEREIGLRKVLNFGHTVAHAIEACESLDGIYHGEAVGLGMLLMSGKEARERILGVLEKVGLPTEYNYDKEKTVAAIKHDKKTDGKKISVVYVDEIGSFRFERLDIDELCERIKSAI